MEKRNIINALVNKEIAAEKVAKNVFNQCLDEENRFISKMGSSFADKVKYIQQLSQRDVENIGKG